MVENVEIVWTLISLFGIIVSSVATIRSTEDLEALRAQGVNSIRQWVAQAARRREFFRLAVQTLFGLVGIIAMFRPPTPVPQESARWATIGLLICAQLIIVANTFFDLRYKQKLVAYIEELESNNS